MMNILDQIISHKAIEVAHEKERTSYKALEQMPGFQRTPLSLKDYLLRDDKTGIIAEFKRRSPSKGIINDRVKVAEVTEAYERFGASGLSILTDREFFGGAPDDLLAARHHQLPILRKEFIIDEYQLVQSKAYGADVVLLIAACLTPAEVKHLSSAARKLGLEVLLELHDEEEMDHIHPGIDLVGINNRDLKTFEVDLQRSAQLSDKLDGKYILVAESGIQKASDVSYLKQYGFRGFLIGEYFMKEEDPGKAFETFTNSLQI